MGGPLCSSVGISVGKEWRSGILRSDAEGSADASLDTSCFGLAGLAGKARLWPLIDSPAASAPYLGAEGCQDAAWRATGPSSPSCPASRDMGTWQARAPLDISGHSTEPMFDHNTV